MEKPPRLDPLAGDPLVRVERAVVVDPPLELPATERTGSGIWSLEGDRLVSVESFDEGPAVVLVRSEHVLVMRVTLPPLASPARRRAALPFAIEDRIAEPLHEVHVALGAETATDSYLAGVVRHELMRGWVLRLAEAGLEQAALVPDALSLPIPGEGSWAVDLAADRAMVRASDGTGFAMPLAMLEAAWKVAGEPACISYGDPLPPNIGAAQTTLEVEPLAKRLLAPALDLRQGPYARPRRAIDPLWKRIATVAALGALAHGVVAAADTLALNHIAAEREAEVRALAASTQPSLVLGTDLGAAVAEMTPDGGSVAPSRFIDTLARVGGALGGLQVPVTWRSVAFDSQAGTLTIAVEASDIAGLQRVAQALTQASLTAQPGAATADQGRAVGTFSVRVP